MNKRIEILTTSQTPGSLDCLVDPATVRSVASIWQGRSEPSLEQILALFSLAEAVVLFDRVILNKEWRVIGGFTEADLSFAEPIAKALSLANDLTSFSVDFGIPNDDAFDHAFSFCRRLEERFGSSWQQMGACPLTANEGFTLDISDTLNVLHRAWRWKTNHVVHPFWEMFFMMVPQKVKTTPASMYGQLDAALEREICKIQQDGHPSVMYVPPIPALALAESKGDLTKFWKSISDIRNEFSSYRQKYAQYQQVLSNPEERSLGELIQARRDSVADVENEIRSVGGKRSDGRKMFEFWDAVAKVEVEGSDGELSFGTGVSLSSLLSFGLRRLHHVFVRGRARSIFSLRKKFLNIRGYESLLSNALKIDLHKLQQQTEAFRQFESDAREAIGEAEEEDWTAS